VNNLSLVALAALPIIPAYSVSKAAAFNMTQSLRALLAAEGVSVHAVVLGPIDTEMNRPRDTEGIAGVRGSRHFRRTGEGRRRDLSRSGVGAHR
jgi:NAD(P)-dependent dehydrogenase (short-subunit alcohol dehydrogenase family)